MKRVIIAALIMVGLVLGVYRYGNYEEMMINRNVRITANGGGGSGTISGSQIITCNHVVGTNDYVWVENLDKRLLCVVTARDPLNDLAYVDGSQFKRTVAPTGKARIGDKVQSVNNGWRIPYSFMEGYVIAERRLAVPIGWRIVISMDGGPGSSGGGVYHNGKLVGIISAYIPGTSHMYVIPLP